MKSILFNKLMYEAILEERKTKTRRLVKGIKPKYNIDDIVYVKEPLLFIPGVSIPYYLHDGDPVGIDINKGHKKSPLFMKERYARLFLRITDVEKEPLNDITERDAIAEGVLSWVEEMKTPGVKNLTWYWDYLGQNFNMATAVHSFRSLWESINGRDAWEKNPEVWVYEFEIAEYYDNLTDLY